MEYCEVNFKNFINVCRLDENVILSGRNNNQYRCDSILQSPIVEMPPSPATNTLMYVEFPDDEVDDNRIADVHNIVEVRIRF